LARGLAVADGLPPIGNWVVANPHPAPKVLISFILMRN
jgi:hypothetical protein